MILPGKYLKSDRALLTVGSEILAVMGERATVSDLWDHVRIYRSRHDSLSPLPFDWFILALSLLYTIGAINLDNGFLTRTSVR